MSPMPTLTRGAAKPAPTPTYAYAGKILRVNLSTGKTWAEASRPPQFHPGGRAVQQVFWLSPGHAREPGVWYAGTSPQGLFRSEDGGATLRRPLGLLAGARSGDKGGTANVGLWVRDDRAYGWLVTTITPSWVRSVVPEAAALTVDVHPLPNLRAVNVVIPGLLGRGQAGA